jgi:hypothetical protein
MATLNREETSELRRRHETLTLQQCERWADQQIAMREAEMSFHERARLLVKEWNRRDREAQAIREQYAGGVR